MSTTRKPTFFVSSTCYDLKQVRSDIRDFFISQLGYDVLLSEYDSFPVNPLAGTVENCLKAVEERADVLVLIVGCRYGSTGDSGQSITNLEYLRAKAKGIPIYAFVDKKILSILPTWRDNPTGNYSATVDSPKLFSFVESIRGSEGVWTFSFDSAKDIISTLKAQLGYLFSESLAIRQKAQKKTSSEKVNGLTGRAFQIAITHPFAWEYKLFGQVLSDRLSSLIDLRRDFNYGITFNPPHYIGSLDEIIDYIRMKLQQLEGSIGILSSIVNSVFKTAIGEPGCPGDEDYIIYAANRMADVYKSIIDWSLDFRTIVVDEDYRELVLSFTDSCNANLNDIEGFSSKYNKIMQALPDFCPDEAIPEIPSSITLTVTPINTEAFNNAIATLMRKKKVKLAAKS